MYSIDAAPKLTGTDVPMLLSAIEEIARQTLRLAHDTSRAASRLGLAGEHLQIVAEDIAILAEVCSQRTHATAALIEASLREPASATNLSDHVASAVDAVATAVADVERQLAGIIFRISRQSSGAANSLREVNPPTELRAKATLLRLALRELEALLGTLWPERARIIPHLFSSWPDEDRQRVCV